MKRTALFCLAAGLLLAGDRGGIRPRRNSTDYPAHQAGKGLTVAATVIAPEQVAKLFATDLNRGGYIVVEVAIYPDQGTDVDLQARDFLLRLGSDPTTERPVDAQTVASSLQRKNSRPPKPGNPGDVTIIPTATIGYESGSSYPNGQRRGGVYTSTGVGVGVGNPGPGPAPRPASTDVDRSTMQQELHDKGLPEGKTSEAVAGYLFFPKPVSGKSVRSSYELTYYAAEGQVSLTIPSPVKK